MQYLLQDLATAMDDGVAGEMVASCNYWEAMSTTTNEVNRGDSKRSASERETGDGEVVGKEHVEPGDSGDGGGDGHGFGMEAGNTPAALGGVEWAVIHLESGNVKVEASATAAEASDWSVCSHERTSQSRTVLA